MFTNPTALFALGLLALPVVIHMLARLGGPRVVFASLRFLPRSVAPRFRLLKVHRWPLLLMRILACALLVLAISGPVFLPGDDLRRSSLILLDASLSMNSETIKESLTGQAREAVSALSAEDRIAVALFDGSARMLCDFTTDRSLVERAIASYTPGYATADFSAALLWADERLRSEPFRRHLVLISDLQATNIASLGHVELSDCHLRVIRIERPVQINASLDPVAVRSFGGQVDVTSALMSSQGNRTEVRPISIRPDGLVGGSEATASDPSADLSARLLDEGLIVGRLKASIADSFDADDDRFFLARLPAEGTVLIVQPLVRTASYAGYVEKALQASLYQVSDVNPARVSDRLPDDSASLRRYRTVICPARMIDKANVSAVRDYIGEGGLVVLTMGVDDGDLPPDLIDAPSIKPLDQAQHVGLLPPVSTDDAIEVEPDLLASYASVRFRRAQSVGVSEGIVVLRYSNGEAAAARISRGRGSLVLLGFGLSDKDTSLVRSPHFPHFIEWLVEGAGLSAGVAHLTVGEVPTSLLGGARKLTRIYPADFRDQEVALDSRLLEEPGVYRVERDSGEMVFAINTPALESRLAQGSEQGLVDRITFKDGSGPSPERWRDPAAGQRFELWWIVAVGALLLSLLELVYCSIDLRAKAN